MRPLARLVRRGQRPAEPAPERLGGADGGPGALSTLELVREPDRGSDATPATSGDACSTDRFVVDPEEWNVEPGGSRGEPPAPPAEDQTTRWRLLARLVLVVVLSLLAFHHSVGSLLRSVATGSVLAYVLAVPVFAGLATAAGTRRTGGRLASTVRPFDVLLGSLLCLAALGPSRLLGPGLSGVYAVWRVDLLMLWLFLLGATVLSFGLRQVVRSWSSWAVLLLLWPFPVRVANTAVSGPTGGMLLLSLVVLAVVAHGHRRDDPPRWQVLGSSAGAAALVLALSGLGTHPQRSAWPALAAAVVAVVWWAGGSRPSPVGPVPEHRVRGTVPILVGLALIGLVTLPPAPRPAPLSVPTGITTLSVGPLEVPGFTRTGTSLPVGQQRYFGYASTWQRVHLRQGGPGAPSADGRNLVVDVISTPRPQALELYPVVTTYPMGTLSATPDAEVDLGHGVAGQLFRAEDARRRIAYTLLTFSWRLPVDMSIVGGYVGPPAPLTQRITLIAVDDQREGAAFPEPGNATLDGISAAVESVGTPQRVRAGSDLLTDEQLLDGTARALVHQQLTGG
jgi:hypothetical protein